MRRARDTDEARALREAKAAKAARQAEAGAVAKAEHDAAVLARDANTERLKALRLARDAADVEMRGMDASAEEKVRRRNGLVVDEPAIAARARGKRRPGR